MQSIANTKDNTWEEMTEPTTSRHGEVRGDLLEEALEILVLGTIKTSDPLTTSTNPGMLFCSSDCSIKRLVFFCFSFPYSLFLGLPDSGNKSTGCPATFKF